VAQERIKFGPGRTDDMPVEMAEFMIQELFRRNRSAFAGAARRYFLELHGGSKEIASETAEE
jgi:hypothetical protein